MDAITTSVAAERLNVPLSTLKAWLDRLDLPLPVDSRGRRMLDADALNWLQTVRSLRESDLGYDTIRRRLSHDGVPVGESSALPSDMLGAVRHAFQEVMAGQNHLSQAYADATRELGRLEGRVVQLQEQVAARDAELERLSALLLAREHGGTDPITGEPTKPGWKFW